jgi:hypothetical protein
MAVNGPIGGAVLAKGSIEVPQVDGVDSLIERPQGEPRRIREALIEQ